MEGHGEGDGRLRAEAHVWSGDADPHGAALVPPEGRQRPFGHVAQRRALPALAGQQVVRLRQGDQPVLEGLQQSRVAAVAAQRLGGDGLHRGERVLDAVVQLVHQQVAVPVGAFGLGDVAGDADDADHRARRVPQRGLGGQERARRLAGRGEGLFRHLGPTVGHNAPVDGQDGGGLDRIAVPFGVRAADHLLGRLADRVENGAVGVEHPALAVLGEKHVGTRFADGAQQVGGAVPLLLAPPQRGDVADGAQHPLGAASGRRIGIAEEESPAARLDQDHSPVRAGGAVLANEVVERVGGIERAGQGRFGAVSVLRHEGGAPGHIGDRRVRRQSEQDLAARVPD